MKDIKKIKTILKAVGIEFNTDRICEVQIGGVWRIIADIPEDLNAIRELELLVMEKFGANEYGACLASEVGGFSILGKPMAPTARIATADAATRIAAMLAVIEENTK